MYADESVFVDWLAVSQYQGKDAPELVGGLRFTVDEDGTPSAESGTGRRIAGSFSSACMVTSHNGWIRFSGNPARWNSRDNLFGYDLDASMAVVNSILFRLGLPEFTRGEPMHQSVVRIDQAEAPKWTGAAFSRIDLTRNFVAGSDLLAKLAIRSYSRRVAGYMRKNVYGEETVLWHNTRRSVKAYRKGPDMKVHCPDSEWTDWACEAGVVRHEVALKSRLLSGTGLRYWGNCDMAKLVRLFDHETAVFRRPDASMDPLALESVPLKARLTYAAWLKGEDVRAILSRPTFYRHRKVLLDVASVDIAEVRPAGADVLPMVREIVLRPAAAPAGYWQRRAA